jgi:hypothetical protein
MVQVPRGRKGGGKYGWREKAEKVKISQRGRRRRRNGRVGPGLTCGIHCRVVDLPTKRNPDSDPYIYVNIHGKAYPPNYTLE